MDEQMESDKWLWQPKKNGPIFLRLTYVDGLGVRKNFVRSLGTSNRPAARRIRDEEFAPIVRSMEEARAKLELIHSMYPKLEKQLKTGLHGGYNDEGKTVRLGEAVDAYVAALSKSGNFEAAERTSRRYGSICRTFATFIGDDRALPSVTTEDVVRYRDNRLESYGASKKTVDLELTALRGLFTFSKERFKLAGNPAQGVAVKRTKAEHNRETRLHKRRPCTREEADRLCSLAPPDQAGYTAADFQDYAMFARYTGMRQGEIAQLRVADFQMYAMNLHADQILKQPASYRKPLTHDVPTDHVPCMVVADSGDRTTKTGLERIVPVAAKLLPVVLRRLLGHRDDAPLFPCAVKDKGSSFGRWWLKKAKNVHAELTMHGFRHYAATEMENQGISEAVSSLILGHSRADVHDQYVHKEIRLLKAAVDRIY